MLVNVNGCDIYDWFNVFTEDKTKIAEAISNGYRVFDLSSISEVIDIKTEEENL